MTPLTQRPLSTPRSSHLLNRGGLSEDQLARRRVRRQLLRYILDTHRRRVAERGLSQQPARQPA